MSFKNAVLGELEALVHVAGNIGRDYVYEVIKNNGNNREVPANSSPVLLYHGYLVTHRCMAGLAGYLKKEGFTPFVREYAYWDDLEAVVKQRSGKLQEFCERTGRQVDLVGHSLGGLIALRKAQENPHLVNKVVMLGSPLQGTIAAYVPYFFHKSCRQMVPGNDFLKLIEEKGFPEGVEFHAIASPYDELSRPITTSLLPEDKYQNVNNHIVMGVGHLGLIGPRCYQLIGDILKGVK